MSAYFQTAYEPCSNIPFRRPSTTAVHVKLGAERPTSTLPMVAIAMVAAEDRRRRWSQASVIEEDRAHMKDCRNRLLNLPWSLDQSLVLHGIATPFRLQWSHSMQVFEGSHTFPAAWDDSSATMALCLSKARRMRVVNKGDRRRSTWLARRLSRWSAFRTSY